MRFLNFLAVCGTFAMCVSLVLAGEFLTLSQTMEQAILNGGPLEVRIHQYELEGNSTLTFTI